MDKIYASAEATIIAAAGGSPNHGFLRISKRTSYRQEYSMINDQLHAVTPPDTALEIKASKWNEPGLFPVSKHRHALDQIFHHLALYTSGNISFPGDILDGMLGIFSAFRKQAVTAKSSRISRRFLQMAGIPIVPNDVLNTYNPIDP
jgi:hypothetical protein